MRARGLKIRADIDSGLILPYKSSAEDPSHGPRPEWPDKPVFTMKLPLGGANIKPVDTSRATPRTSSLCSH